MVVVKDLAVSAQKFTRNASSAASEYATNAANAATRWQTNSAAAQQTFQQAITAPGVPQRYGRGVQRAGAAKYQGRVQAVGQNRYSEGVGVSQDDWQSGFQPFAQALASLTLSGRRPRGDAQNYRRVEEVGKRLNATRIAQLGGAPA